jgi:hypothetical protein
MTCFFVGQHFSKKNIEVLEKKSHQDFGSQSTPVCMYKGPAITNQRMLDLKVDILSWGRMCILQKRQSILYELYNFGCRIGSVIFVEDTAI